MLSAASLVDMLVLVAARLRKIYHMALVIADDTDYPSGCQMWWKDAFAGQENVLHCNSFTTLGFIVPITVNMLSLASSEMQPS